MWKMAAGGRLFVLIFTTQFTALFLGTAFAAPPVQSRSATYNLDIPAQSLKDALQALALASRHKLLYSSELVDGKASPALKGQFTIEQAVQVLLSGTHLSYEVTSDGLVLVRASDPPNGTNTAAPLTSGGVGLVVASATSTPLSPLQPTAHQPARSTPEDKDAGELAEITVTVQRRSQNIQDVGTSITVLQAEDLRSLGTSDLTAITTRTPALQYLAFSPASTVFNIRGVSQNDYGEHQEAPIAVYLDDSYISAMSAIGIQMFDLQSVEVDRGPQGTLFGRNATGGLIHMITTKPTDTPEGYVTVTGGSYDLLSTEAAYGGPLADGLRGRVSLATNYNSGYITNRTGPNLGNSNNYALRLQLEADIGSNATLLVNLHGARDNAERYGDYTWTAAYPTTHGLGAYLPANVNFWNTCPGCDALGYKNPSSDPFDQSYNGPIYFDRTIDGVAGTLSWKLPFGTMVSVSDFSHVDMNYREDSNASPDPVISYEPNQHQYQYSEELRLSGDHGGLNWTTGLFYLDISSHQQVFLYAYPSVADTVYTTRTSSGAAFGQLDYAFDSHWSVIGGLRYSSDLKQQIYELAMAGTPTIYFNPQQDPGAARKTFDGVSAKAELDYKPIDRLLAYLSYNRGIKGGGFLAPTFPPVDVSKIPFGTEVLTDYEAGVKLKGLGGRLTLNAGAFYYNYHNYQAFSFSNLIETITNHDAIDKGGEIELTALPLTGLTVQIGLSLLTTEVKQIALPDGTLVNTVMPQAPANSSTLLVKYEHTLGNGTAFIQTDWKHDASQYFTAVNNPDEYEAPRTYGNVRVGYAGAGGRWKVSAYVNNVTDKIYSVFRSDFSSIGQAENVLAKPRWFGLSVNYSFGQ